MTTVSPEARRWAEHLVDEHVAWWRSLTAEEFRLISLLGLEWQREKGEEALALARRLSREEAQS